MLGRLPAERQLADERRVADGTVRHGIALLRERGLVATRHGLASFVPSSRRWYICQVVC